MRPALRPLRARRPAQFRQLVNSFASLLLPPAGSQKPSPLLEALAAEPAAHAALHTLLSKVRTGRAGRARPRLPGRCTRGALVDAAHGFCQLRA